MNVSNHPMRGMRQTPPAASPFITRRSFIMIRTIAKPAERKVTACGECRSTCQSACKTSCTVGNQSCERITREQEIEKAQK